MSKSDERVFQNEMIDSLIANGWMLGDPKNYNRELALYEEDLLGFVQESQPKMWAKYVKNYGENNVADTIFSRFTMLPRHFSA